LACICIEHLWKGTQKQCYYPGTGGSSCNPTYSGGRNQEDHSRGQPGQIVLETLLKKTHHKKMGWWSGSRCRLWVQTPVPKKKVIPERETVAEVEGNPLIPMKFWVIWIDLFLNYFLTSPVCWVLTSIANLITPGLYTYMSL
jgi:hypothetical protein